MENNLRPQTPSEGFDWLYRDFAEDDRKFSKLIYLGINDTPWDECTQAEREQWEEEHKPEPEPVPEPETKQKEE